MTAPTTRAEDLLCDFIRFPTQQASGTHAGGDETALCRHLAKLLEARSADEIVVETAPRTDGSTGAFVFARWGAPKLVINAHVDTVPANAGWTRDPWTPHVDRDGGRLYGLGSADTKGAIAAALVALERIGPPRDCAVLFSGDEEAGSAVMRAFLDRPAARGIERVIICEPTARRAGIAHRGVVSQRAELRGPGGHSSKADREPKPMVQLARFAVALDELGRRRLDDGPPGMTGTCLNIAALEGGVAFNVIPARAELIWSIRPYPGFDRAGWDADLTAAARAIDPGIAIESAFYHEPFACDALADRVRPFVREVGTLDFWTEAALFGARGIDAIVVGPGDIAQAHAADEFVAVDDLAWATDLFAALLAGAR
ncbi:MAG: M20/M25/M40 family metallo-hydrolase [Deltaproteobacteria bacterium]|nr:M20/M25/M40 family metallo-hydrolase [Deltaproteobacteria bacterium]